MMKPEYLSEYTDTIEALPLELQRNFTLIRQLDESAEKLMDAVATECTQLTSAESMPADKRRQLRASIGKLLNEALKRGEEKFALAKSTYDIVDRHCTRLDGDLQKFEDEQLIGRSATVNPSSSADAHSSDERPMKRRKGQTARSRKKDRSKRTQESQSDHKGSISTEDSRQNAQAAISMSDLPIDPNEPLYCYCRQVSYGEMVACDNEECDIEWFHLECAGLRMPPKGSWYCKNCLTDVKGKKRL